MKRKLFSLFSVCFFLAVFACSGNTPGGSKPTPSGEDTPRIKKLEVFKMDGSTSIFSVDNPKNSNIVATSTEEERVKIKVTADTGVTVTYNPTLEGAGKNEWSLSTIGKNTLTITLNKGSVTKAYTLEIERTQQIPPPVIKKLEVFKMDGSTSIFSVDNPKNSNIVATSTEEERVKIKVTTDTGVNVTYNPTLEGAGKDELSLSTIGKNTLTITLSKGSVTKAYTLEIERLAIVPPSNKVVKNIKVGAGHLATWESAIQATATTNPDEYTVEFDHRFAEQKYSLFVEAESVTDVVFIDNFTKQPPYPKADKSGIREIADLPAVGQNSVLEFYLFQKEGDVKDKSLGKKYTVKLNIKTEPNAKIKTVTFNDNPGVINEGNRNITCETKFPVNTEIATVVTLEETGATHKIVGNDNKPLQTIKILASGARFKIIVTPKEGKDFDAIYYVTLQAQTQAGNTVINKVKYYANDSVAANADAITDEATKDPSNDKTFLIAYNDEEFVCFVFEPAENIEKVEREISSGTYYSLAANNGYFMLKKRDLRDLAKGMKIKVTFKDATTNEFIIKKQ